MEENMLCAISLVVQIFSAITIGRYDPSHSSRPILCPTWPDNGSWTAAWQRCQQLKSYPGALVSFAFDDPSPAAFEGALAVFTLATLYIYSSYREERHQNLCLVAAVVTTAITSITKHIMFLNESLAHSVQICLPASVLIVSAVSVIFHRVAASATSRGQEVEWQQKEKTFTEGQEKGEKHGS